MLAAPDIGRFASTARQASGYISGSLLNLPAGAVDVVIGGEARTEELEFNSSGIELAVDRNTQAVFGEVRVPLAAPDMGLPLVQRLAITAAVRYDHYSDFGNTLNPEYRLEWGVNRNLLLRASYGTSFRPPSLFELYQPERFAAGLVVIDPRRNNERYSADIRTGGNTELDPEEAETFSAGLIFNPVWWDGFRFVLDYWRVEQNLRVQRFTSFDVLRNESTFPNRVIRGEPTTEDVAAGIPGRILLINATSINYGGVETDGVDIKAEYNIETDFGTLRPSLAATYVESFKVSQFPNQPAIDRAGVAHFPGSIPDWRATAGLAWSWRDLQVATTGRYTHSYEDANLFGVKSGQKVDAQLIIDLHASLTLGERFGPLIDWLDAVTIQGGVINLFDEEPPFSEVLGIVGYPYDPSQADLRRRFVYLKISKPF